MRIYGTIGGTPYNVEMADPDYGDSIIVKRNGSLQFIREGGSSYEAVYYHNQGYNTKSIVTYYMGESISDVFDFVEIALGRYLTLEENQYDDCNLPSVVSTNGYMIMKDIVEVSDGKYQLSFDWVYT